MNLFQSGSDGQISTFNITSTYNSANKPTKIEEDTNGDGVLDVIHHYEYDDEQRQILEESDLNGNGEIDTRQTITFDDSSNTATIHEDSNADGIIDAIATNAFDKNNNIISQSIDEDNDGTFEDIITWDYTYDSEGNILSTNKLSTNSPEENQLTTVTYDDDGRFLTYSNVFANAPEQNQFNVATYDEAGDVTFSSLEQGVINTFSYYRYTTVTHDIYGGSTTTYYDMNNEVKSVYSTFHDDRGNVIEDFSSETDDGVVSIHKTNRTYNNNDQLTTETVVSDRRSDSITEYTYDEQGEPIATTTTTVDDQNDGEAIVTTITYQLTDLASWQALYYRLDRDL